MFEIVLMVFEIILMVFEIVLMVFEIVLTLAEQSCIKGVTSKKIHGDGPGVEAPHPPPINSSSRLFLSENYNVLSTFTRSPFLKTRRPPFL